MTDDADEAGIAARVRAARERTGLSREALAFHSGISWSAIAQVESGRRTNLRPHTLAALAGTLGVTIDYLVCGHDRSRVMLEHQALLYDDDQQFARVAEQFLSQASDRSEPALAVISRAKIARLRGRLGPRAERVRFADHKTWYRGPASGLGGYRAFVDRSLAGGAAWVRILAEPVRTGRQNEVGFWSRYEGLLNLVFRADPVTLLCSYDVRRLDRKLIEHACATHRHTLGRDALRPSPSPSYRDPARLLLEG